MTLKNNREPFPCLYKLCVSFHNHPWIQIRVTRRKHSYQSTLSVFFSSQCTHSFRGNFGRKLWVWRLTTVLSLSLPCCTQYCVKTDRVINGYQQYIHQQLRCIVSKPTTYKRVTVQIYLTPSFHLIRFIRVFHHEVQSMLMLCVSKRHQCKRIGHIMFYLRSAKYPTG